MFLVASALMLTAAAISLAALVWGQASPRQTAAQAGIVHEVLPVLFAIPSVAATTGPGPGKPSLSSVPAAQWLPSAPALFHISATDLERVSRKYQQQVRVLADGIFSVADAALDGAQVEHFRRAMLEVTAAYLDEHSQVISRIRARHLAHDAAGDVAAGLRTLSARHEELIELCGQKIGELAAIAEAALSAPRLAELVSLLQTSTAEQLEELAKLRWRIAEGSCSLAPRALDNALLDEGVVHEHLKRLLKRWWESHWDARGAMSIALFDARAIREEFSELDERAAQERLESIARALARNASSPGSAVRGLDMELRRRDGLTSTISWSCAVVERTDGSCEAVIATGFDRLAKPTPLAASSEPRASAPDRAGEQATSAGAERREKPRLPFRHVQLIAPASGLDLPPTAEFYEVLCYDISEGGVSFLAPAMPKTASVVVALGTRQPHIYLTARLVHFRKLSGEFAGQYLIGCQFTGRTMIVGGGQQLFASFSSIAAPRRLPAEKEAAVVA